MEDKNDLNKIWATSLISILCMLAVTGCWDRREIKDLALVMASGIDRTENGQLRGTLQIAVPAAISAGGGGSGTSDGGLGKSFVLVSESGRNIKDMIQRLQEKVPRELYFSHRAVFIVGEREAQIGISDILDQFARDPENRMRNLILVAKGEKAADVLAVSTVLEKIPGQEIKQIEKQETGTMITMLDFMMASSSEGMVPVAPAIRTVEGGTNKQGQQKLMLAGTAVFKDLKLVGYLNNQETRGFLWMTGKMHKGFITAYIPEGRGSVTLSLTSAKRDVKPIFDKGHIVFEVKLEGKGQIEENDTNLNLSDPKSMMIVKKALDRQVFKYVLRSFKMAQVYDADVFGFGLEIDRHSPKRWDKIKDKWDTLFREAVLHLRVDIKPLRPGIIGPPLQMKEDEVKKPSS